MKMNFMTLGLDYDEKIAISINGIFIYPSREFIEVLQKELSKVEMPTGMSFEKLEDVKREINHWLKKK